MIKRFNSKKKKKVLVLIDADIVVRAFIQSNTFRELKEDYIIEYCVAKDFKLRRSALSSQLEEVVDERVIYCNTPRKRMGYWYFLFAAHALFVNRGTANYNIIKNYKFKRELGVRNRAIVEFFSLNYIYPIFSKIFKLAMGKNHHLEEVISQARPDAIIHPTLLTGWFINDVVSSAKKMNIPTIFCMNSWDNPSSKAVCAEHPNKLIVWGEQSKEEAIRYLGIAESKIEIFGAAQFQLYRNELKNSNLEIREKLKLPKNKKVLLYAGTGESINETKYLQNIDAAICKGLIGDCHVLYRPHPWRGKLQKGEEDFFALRWKNVSIDPSMASYYKQVISKPTRTFFSTDYRDTQEILSVVSGVISARSTLLIEALINGLPILVLFPREIESEIFSSEFIHFKSLVSAPEINCCYNIDKLNSHLKLLNHEMEDQSNTEKLKKFSEKFVDMGEPNYGKRLLDLTNELTN